MEHDKYGYYVACIQCGADYPVDFLHYDDALEKVELAEPVGSSAR
jgi:hypothetical protein